MPTSEWTTDAAARLYQVDLWSQGYFVIGADGRVKVRPDRTADCEIDLPEVVAGLAERELYAPVLVRFSDILADRLRSLHDAFDAAIGEHGYDGRYVAVYPIKVNQQRPVVEEVYRYGREFDFGLEVGSKPELLAVMAMTDEAEERLIVCNGFKDDEYIEAVILSTKLGRNIIPRAMLPQSPPGESRTAYLRMIQTEHRRIADAIGARDEDTAREAMRAHLMGSQQRYRTRLRGA